MLQKKLSLWLSAAVLGVSSFSVQAVPTVDLFGYSLNIDGSVSDVIDNYSATGSSPSELDDSLFNNLSGLGELSITLYGGGNHQVIAFFDHEISESQNSFFNETGAASGIAGAGQSWEIDEPGFGGNATPDYTGDIYDNFYVGQLDGQAFYDDFTGDHLVDLGRNTEDVSMAMGWDFSLGMDEKAIISYVLTDSAPTSGFYLTQYDPDSDYSIYLSSSLNISAIPEPSILLLFGVGLVGLAFGSRRRSS